ncbi:uncharacterized protein K02A2.6-like [Wyeomyia smithii]|uniref:uncharacterized protein K02A2.6-like n=1 Tax=Wyeomyia smithii TaxID=174621 RepID=UPI0024680850|nr:uncharacterized protein K02A2.6-like [Wyeomyia smithii]
MGSDIQELIDACRICQIHQRDNVKQTIVPKETPSLPFQRVASDLFHFKGKDYILIVNSYSGFFDFKELSELSSQIMIAKLKEWYAVHGVPRVLESDNGPQYSSGEFQKFAKNWDFDHNTSSPCFSRANGLAERYVQTAKTILKKCAEDESDVQLALLHARNTPRSFGLPAPSERLMGKLLRTNLPTTDENFQPKVISGVPEALYEQWKLQKQYADRGALEPNIYQPGEPVLLQHQHTKTWRPVTVMQCVDGRR